MKTIVIGLGNPILGDDGVGWRVAEQVRNVLSSSQSEITVDCLSLGGLSLMEHLIGYQRLILIDALLCEQELGSIRVTHLEELSNPPAVHTASAHDTSLQNALQLGREMGVELPVDITVVGICTASVHDFSEHLSPPVRDAVPKAIQIVIHLLQ